MPELLFPNTSDKFMQVDLIAIELRKRLLNVQASREDFSFSEHIIKKIGR